ncbi:MAG: hypothetical protein ABIS14_06250, partial [Sphingomonas sp.]
QLAAVSDGVHAGGCTTDRVVAVMRVRTASAGPSLSGPVRAASVRCGVMALARIGADVSVALDPALNGWTGHVATALGGARYAAIGLGGTSGTIDFQGNAAETRGTMVLVAQTVESTVASAHTARLAGDFRIARQISLSATMSAENSILSRQLVERLAGSGSAGQGTPIGPVLAQISHASASAARSFSISARVRGVLAGGSGRLDVARLDLNAATGFAARLTDSATSYAWPSGAMRVAGTLAMAGGGMPSGRVTVAQAAPGDPLTGTATFRPYVTGGASVALAPVRFAATPGGNTRFVTRVALTGPIGGGRVENLAMPVEGAWDGGKRVIINPRCAPLSFDRLAVSGLVLGSATLALCPSEAALVTIDRGRVSGGVNIVAPRLTGTLGSSPVTLSAAAAHLGIADARFALSRIAARIGLPDRVTRLDFATLDGRLVGGGLVGQFVDGGGTIGNVPLLLSKAAGSWRLRDGALGVTGTLAVNDAAPVPRFKTLAGRDVALSLAGGKLVAKGILVTPAKSVEVARVRLAHDLSSGTGHADLTVSGITFGKAIQPDDLTPLTYGVIADVAGTVSGDGHIEWTPAGVTSSGVFRTAGTDLAAAFGPVTGVAGDIRFTD